jgi:precorrin-6B methylase 1
MREENRFVLDIMTEEPRERNSRMALATMLGTIPRFDLACLGISLHGLGALTFEAVACLASADVVYCYPTTAAHYNLTKLINDNVINLYDTLYTRGSEFEPTYDAIIKEVMRAVRGGSKVAYATQGSPAFHCGTATSLHRAAKREGFSSILISGVSSFELLSAELAADYDITNIQIYSTLQFTDGTIEINPNVPCLLFDLGRYALPAVREEASRLDRGKLAALAKLLGATYPADHEIVLMSVRTNGFCWQSKTTPAGFEEAVVAFGSATTIFLPAVR